MFMALGSLFEVKRHRQAAGEQEQGISVELLLLLQSHLSAHARRRTGTNVMDTHNLFVTLYS